MHADLVGAAGVDADAEEGGAVEALLDPPRGACLPPAGGAHRHLLPVDRVAADRGVDLARGPGGHAEHEGEVLLLDRPAGELPDEGAVGLVVLGDHQEAGGALVEPVDDARAEDAADAGEVVHVAEQRVDERAARRARARVHDEPGRLVHDEEVGVLVNDGDVDVLGLRLGGHRGGHGHEGGLSRPHPGRGAAGAAVDEDVALVDESPETGAGERGQALREPDVEAQAGGVLVREQRMCRSERPGSDGPRGIDRGCGFLVARHVWSSSE